MTVTVWGACLTWISAPPLASELLWALFITANGSSLSSSLSAASYCCACAYEAALAEFKGISTAGLVFCCMNCCAGGVNESSVVVFGCSKFLPT
jgi:hypothetical protein